MKQLMPVSVLLALALAVGMTFQLEPLGLRYHLDADVYRLGAQQLLADGDLYGTTYQTRDIGLPFTYPPFAALLFLPLAPLSAGLAGLVLTLLNLALAAALTWLVLRVLQVPRPGTWALLLLPVVLVAEPIWETIMFGQVNLLLAALVLVDALILTPRNSRWRGVLTGVAAAIKLTPLVFILVPAARRDLGGVLRVLAGFAGATALGALVAPRTSWEYFSSVLADTDRIGGSAYAANQSLAGLWDRLGVPELWLPSVAIVGVLVLLALAKLRRLGDTPAVTLAMVLVASMASGLGSPVSWSHHWVWLVPAVLLMALIALRSRGRLRAAWAGLATLSVAALLARPHFLLPHGADAELSWPWWAQLLGSSYVLLGLAFLLLVLASRTPARARQAASVSI